MKDGKEIQKTWKRIYSFKINEKKALYYQTIFENLCEFENYYLPGGKIKSIKEKFNHVEIPVYNENIDLSQYIELKEELNELQEKITQTDRIINQIVYKLYGLTEEEIKVVEDSFDQAIY